MRVALTLAYNGRNYHGWQIQENAHSVQQEIQAALSRILRYDVELTGCGRTDTGVHARDFKAHFDTESELPDNLVFRLNSMLPADIGIKDCKVVPDSFHARFSAISRTYRYYIHQQKDPFLTDFSWLRHGEVSVADMNAAASLTLGTHEFRCFCKGEPPNDNYRCTVTSAFWTQTEKQLIFEVTANRFLRNMVRAMVGTLLETGTGKLTQEAFANLMQSGTRSDAGNSVPAHGLFLEAVTYPEF